MSRTRKPRRPAASIDCDDRFITAPNAGARPRWRGQGTLVTPHYKKLIVPLVIRINRANDRRGRRRTHRAMAAGESCRHCHRSAAPSEWPFRYPLCPELPAGPVLLRAANVDTAFVNTQSGGTHLVTTQRGYLEAEWTSALSRHGDARLVIEISAGRRRTRSESLPWRSPSGSPILPSGS
jgi:hypothetical protein